MDKTQRSKWVYKRNKVVSGIVETYIDGHIVKGYSTKLGFDYEKPFYP